MLKIFLGKNIFITFLIGVDVTNSKYSGIMTYNAAWYLTYGEHLMIRDYIMWNQ